MASWVCASQLFLVVLFSWSVHSVPVQNDWGQSTVRTGKVNPGPQNAKTEGSRPMSSNPAGTSVSWVVVRPQRKSSFVRPSNQIRPAVSLVPNPPKLLPALKPEGPANLWSTEAPKELPLPTSDPEGPVASLPVAPLTELSPHPKLQNPFEILELTPPPPQNPKESALSIVDPPESLPLPPSNPEGPEVSWLVEPAKKVHFPSNPDMPLVPWKVGSPKNFPPPSVLEVSTDNWLADHLLKAQTLRNTKGTDTATKEMVAHPPTSENAAVSWVVQPPKRKLLLQSPDPLVLTTDEHESDPFRAAVAQLGEMPLERFASYLPLTPDLILPPVVSEDLSPLKGGPEQGVSEGETEPLAYQESSYQGGELSRYASLYKHGVSERETEDYIVPMYLYGAGGMPIGVMPPLPYLNQVVPNMFYLFLNGWLPDGTVSRMQTNYETDGDYTTQVGYEK
ncbi:proline-rich receptor-like protein kinase PERK10 isoform X1 [Gambusia affinis]|uniref:proline-rich receptor-like protein kinase PERK10 isoform X1 n=1 Tax=Gambusia affinis TaxID=33528 RepID=UPI001CDBB720|nr:proline-rich receptor-like protein kinase PERK10 isoform X1 [Gambusia affinis]